jgi:KaiC/GvpD/RAD55 family RecA-like ATPase
MVDVVGQMFIDWRRLIATGPTVDARTRLFGSIAHDVAGYVARGFDKKTAVDELHDIAVVNGLVAARGEDEIQDTIAEAFLHVEVVPSRVDVPEKNNGRTHHQRQQKLPEYATPYPFPKPDTIRRRGWLHAGHYVRDAVTATVAPGGFGKTTLSLFEALTMAGQGLHVWYLSGEDPIEEIDRRVAAHCLEHAVDTSKLAGKFFVDDKVSFPLSLTSAVRGAMVVFDEPALTALSNAIARDKIDVLIIDPFISFHSVTENDNAAMDQVIKRLGRICQERNCNIEISHHVRKQAAGQTELTVDDTRGGGSIVNAVRSCRIINRMTAEQAEQARVNRDERSSYIRIDRGKRNMAPPENAVWMHIVSVLLPNGDPVGDNVQAIRQWEFPNLFSEVTTVDRDHFQKLANTGNYAADSRSEKWLGHELARRFNRDVTVKGDVIWICQILKRWQTEGLFAKAKKYDATTRKSRLFFVAAGSADEAENDL